MVAQVFSEIDIRRSALSDLSLESVAVAQRFREALHQHGACEFRRIARRRFAIGEHWLARAVSHRPPWDGRAAARGFPTIWSGTKLGQRRGYDLDALLALPYSECQSAFLPPKAMTR